MQILKILFKNAFRHKLRTGLTILSITIALLAFGLLRTVINAWYSGVEASSAYRLVTRNAVSIIFPLPLSYKDRYARSTGVRGVLGELVRWHLYRREELLRQFCRRREELFRPLPRIRDPRRPEGAFFRDRKGFVAGRKLAERFGWKIGDTIILKGTIFPGNWEFVMRAVYRGRRQTLTRRSSCSIGIT
jgi:putative ABC transport system permease protein